MTMTSRKSARAASTVIRGGSGTLAVARGRGKSIAQGFCRLIRVYPEALRSYFSPPSGSADSDWVLSSPPQHLERGGGEYSALGLSERRAGLRPQHPGALAA